MDKQEANRDNKYEALKENLRSLGSVAVAFSSGVDSTFLLKTAHDVLGDAVIAVTVESDFFPRKESREAERFCKSEGIRQYTCRVDESEILGFCENPKNRCYLCKKTLFQKMMALAAEHNIANVAEGSNVDDLGDYRPGLAAVEELGIKSPLREVGLTKSEIRSLSKECSLPTWDKPSYACLASRFVYGEEITKEKLYMVERAEELLTACGFRQMRVRMHGKMARIEVPPEMFEKLLQNEIRETILKEFAEYGFSYVSMDLKGYRTGSMNETI